MFSEILNIGFVRTLC